MPIRQILLFLVFLLSPPAFAGVKSLWIIAPHVFLANEEKRVIAEERLNSILNKNGIESLKVSIVPDVSKGFATTYYLNFWKNNPKEWPDYLIYYQPARFLAFDLEELLLSDVGPHQFITSLDKNIDAKQDLAPKFLESILSDNSRKTFKKLIYYRKRLAEVGPWFFEKDQDRLLMEMSTWPLQTLQYFMQEKSGKKTKFLLFLSPERVRYQSDIFANKSWAGLVAQIFWIDKSFSRPRLKELLQNVDLNTVLLPTRFGDLNQRVYLRANTVTTLNSAGVERWTELMGSTLSDPNSPIR